MHNLLLGKNVDINSCNQIITRPLSLMFWIKDHYLAEEWPGSGKPVCLKTRLSPDKPSFQTDAQRDAQKNECQQLQCNVCLWRIYRNKKKKYQITKELLALSHLPSSPGFTQDIVAIFDSLFNVATLERHKDSISFQHTHKNIKAVKYNIVDSWGIY